MNVQFAVPRDGRGIFILEVNPRASRTVPFVSKVTGVPLAKIAARIAVGRTLAEMGVREVDAQARRGQGGGVPVREVRRRGHPARPRDALDRRGDGHRSRASRRRSPRASSARAPACRVAGAGVPVAAGQRQAGRAWPVAQALVEMGFEILATNGTHDYLTAGRREGHPGEQGARGAAALRRPHAGRRRPPRHEHHRRARRRSRTRSTSAGPRWCAGIPYYTTLSAAKAAVGAIAELRSGPLEVRSLQEYQQERWTAHGRVSR